jgi:hypothetical protein
MNNRKLYMLAGIAALFMASLACGPLGGGSAPQITGTVAPMTIGADLTQIDVCAAVPKSVMEGAIGRTLASPPTKFNYYDTPKVSGCMYDGGKDSSGQAYYGYVALTPLEDYDNQPLYQNKAVSGLGDEAYFNNGADTRQLWVRIKGKVAFVVAVGDVADESKEQAVAQLVVAAIK